jgi:hypothetical protein
MRSSTKTRAGARRHRHARRLAPHVTPQWAEDFVIELRLLGIEGARIGDALSEVESHCAESAESAQQAFGSSAEYARSLGLQTPSHLSARALLRSTLPTVAQVLGMLVLIWGFTAWREGGRLEVTTAHLVTVTLFLLTVAALVRFSDSVLGHLVHHPLLGSLLVMANMAGVALSFAFLGDVIWRVGAGWCVAAGATALIGGLAWEVTRRLAAPSLDDPITAPLGAGSRPSSDAPGPHRMLIASIPSPAAAIALVTLALLATTWLLT